jgi:hypothetical protein
VGGLIGGGDLGPPLCVLFEGADYEEAVEQMLAATDHEAGPWQVVAAESKRYARVRVLELVISAIEDALRAHGQTPVEAEAVL